VVRSCSSSARSSAACPRSAAGGTPAPECAITDSVASTVSCSIRAPYRSSASASVDRRSAAYPCRSRSTPSAARSALRASHTPANPIPIQPPRIASTTKACRPEGAVASAATAITGRPATTPITSTRPRSAIATSSDGMAIEAIAVVVASVELFCAEDAGSRKVARVASPAR
jgi:hypothetical protein